MTYTGRITLIDVNANGIMIGQVESPEAFPEWGYSKFNDRNCYNSKVEDYKVGDEVEFEINKYNYPKNLRLKDTPVETAILKEFFVDWFALKEDFKDLCPEIKDKDLSEKEIFWCICNKNIGRNEIVYLDYNGKACDKDSAYHMYIPTGYKSGTGKELFLKYRKQLIKD